MIIVISVLSLIPIHNILIKKSYKLQTLAEPQLPPPIPLNFGTKFSGFGQLTELRPLPSFKLVWRY